MPVRIANRRRILAASVGLVIALAAAGGQAYGAERPSVDRPAWAKARRMTVFVDSVLLGGIPALRTAMPDWRVAVRGRPALMVRAAERELKSSGARVSGLVVVGLGYNSLWERGRRNFDVWAERFDAEARRFVRLLRARGAGMILWVTLRRPTFASTPPGGAFQIRDYAWYFGYVNARLQRLDRRRGKLELVRWDRVSRRRGLTYDAIHLNPRGAALMADTIEGTARALARGERPAAS